MVRFQNGLRYNPKRRVLTDTRDNIHLTHSELQLLELLINNTGKAVPHQEIKNKVWHDSYEVSDSAFKSLLNKLRSKIGKESIKNISGVGYAIQTQ